MPARRRAASARAAGPAKRARATGTRKVRRPRKQSARQWFSKVVRPRMPSGMRRKPRRASRRLAPRSVLGPSFFSALGPWKSLVCPVPSLGNAVPLRTRTHQAFQVTSSVGALIHMTQSTQGIALTLINDHLGATSHGQMIPVFFQEVLDDKGPAFSRPSRKTLVLSNVSRTDSISGSVFALATPNPLEVTENGSYAKHLSPDSMVELLTLVQNAPNSKQFAAHQFAGAKQFSLGFASTAMGALYQENDYPASPGTNWTFARWAADAKLGATSSILIYIPATADTQSYEISCVCQEAGRYPANSLMGSLATQATPVPPAGFQAANAAQSSIAQLMSN